MLLKNRIITRFVVAFAFLLGCASCDQPAKRAEEPPPSSPTPTPKKLTEPEIRALLIKKAAALNAGRTNDEEWSSVDYDLWRPNSSSEGRYGGVIQGNIRRFTNNKPTSVLAYKAALSFANEAWVVNDIVGKEVAFLPVHLLTERDLPSDPSVDSSAQGLDGAALQASSGMSRQLAYLQRKIENRQREANSFKVSSISAADRSAIQQRLEEPPADLPPESESSVKEHTISWDEVNTFFNSSENTVMQKREEWKRYKGKQVNWKGIVHGISESSIHESFGDTVMNMEMDGHVEGVVVYLDSAQKSKALGLHPGDGVEYSAKLNFCSDSNDTIFLEDGQIIGITSKEQLERVADGARRQKELADQAERDRFERLAASTPPVSTTPTFQTVADAQREALRRYPDLGIEGSPFNTEFLARYRRYQQENPDYLSNPSWPFTIAEETARALDPNARARLAPSSD